MVVVGKEQLYLYSCCGGNQLAQCIEVHATASELLVRGPHESQI